MGNLSKHQNDSIAVGIVLTLLSLNGCTKQKVTPNTKPQTTDSVIASKAETADSLLLNVDYETGTLTSGISNLVLS